MGARPASGQALAVVLCPPRYLPGPQLKMMRHTANHDDRLTGDLPRRRLAAGALAYGGLLAVFWLIARFFHLKALSDSPGSTVLSFALMFAPYWLFGFGLADVLRRYLAAGAARIAAALLLTVPYFVLTIPQGTFQWPLAVLLAAICLLVAFVLHRWRTPGNWADLIILLVLGLTIDLGLLSRPWFLTAPGVALWPAGLGGFPKMMMANLALYGYLVIKPLPGIGYDLVPELHDFKTGLREFIFYAPIVLVLGFSLGFLHWQGLMSRPAQFPAAWMFTFIFVALPEELFFRGLVQNLLEKQMGRVPALWTASVLFGLSHFNKGAVFNWRYVILATIAGLFYGRAWRPRRRLFASSVTHATVDAVWSVWFR